MSTVTIEQAQATLIDLIDGLRPGEPVVITRDARPVARLIAEQSSGRRPRRAGSAKGILTILSNDEEHLRDFEEYME